MLGSYVPRVLVENDDGHSAYARKNSAAQLWLHEHTSLDACRLAHIWYSVGNNRPIRVRTLAAKPVASRLGSGWIDR